MCGQEREWENKVTQEKGEKPGYEEEGRNVGSQEENAKPGSPHGTWRPSEMSEPSSQGSGRSSHSRRVTFDPQRNTYPLRQFGPFLSEAFFFLWVLRSSSSPSPQPLSSSNSCWNWLLRARCYRGSAQMKCICTQVLGRKSLHTFLGVYLFFRKEHK